MIIYIPSNGIKEFENLCCSKANYVNTEEVVMFYSEYGIFMLKNNIFYKQNIEPVNVIIDTISGTEILIDKTNISYKKLFSQIPADCVAKLINRKIYQISDVRFVVVTHGNILFDCYIEIKNNVLTSHIKSIISSFLFD